MNKNAGTCWQLFFKNAGEERVNKKKNIGEKILTKINNNRLL